MKRYKLGPFQSTQFASNRPIPGVQKPDPVLRDSEMTWVDCRQEGEVGVYCEFVFEAASPDLKRPNVVHLVTAYAEPRPDVDVQEFLSLNAKTPVVINDEDVPFVGIAPPPQHPGDGSVVVIVVVPVLEYDE